MFEMAKIGVWWVLLSGMAFQSMGCATLHPGWMAHPVGEAASVLRVSVHDDERMSDEHFKLVYVTLENRSDEWVRFEQAVMHFGSMEDNRKLVVVYGKDIADWYDARTAELEMERHQRNMFLVGLAITGAVVAGVGNVSGSGGTRAAGHLALGVAEIGLLGSLAGDAVQDNLDRLQNARHFPEHHLLAGGIAIPPGKFVRKWILFQVKAADWQGLQRLVLDFMHKDGKVEQFQIQSAGSPGGSLRNSPAMFEGYEDPYAR